MTELISKKLLKAVAIWSLIPSYLAAGGGIGYGLDAWFGTFPLFMGLLMFVGFGLAVRDMLRLKKELFR
jgi:F0F1-type ATP synthase assembly protein I